jgi:hypothetical protein
MVAIFLMSLALHAAPPAEAQFALLGYSPELKAVFAQDFMVPDDGHCVSYILDLDKKIKFILPAIEGVHQAVVEAGGDEEAASCATREFEGQLEIKLKADKDVIAPFEKANWKKALPGFKDMSITSLGAWLHKQRPKWHPELAAKLYELGVQAGEDKDWLDGFSALVIAAEWKPGYLSKEGKARADQITQIGEELVKAGDGASVGKAILAWEMAVRLDPGQARAYLDLGKQDRGGFERRARLVLKALRANPVMTTRAFREDSGFADLRCEKKAEHARHLLPSELIKDLKCSS